MTVSARSWLERIRALDLPERIRILNVCGGHERAITQAGLRTALPKQVELIPGPGCPVCVCPEEDVYEAMRLALNEDVLLVAFGDMLRVPVNVAKGEPRSLEQARAAGGDVQPIASPLEAVAIAQRHPRRQVVFFAAGFETTSAPVAAMMAAGVPDNLSILLSGRRTWPAVAMLLDSGEARFDALIAPGHVATVMGPEEWSFVVERHAMPTAIAGFNPESLLAAIYSVLRQTIASNVAFLDNCYPELVRPGGNPTARRQLDRVFQVTNANWRGIGQIAASGYGLGRDWTAWDSRQRFPSPPVARRRAGEMPPGCDCAGVVLGRIYPNECALYGRACTPRKPVGPCMVSDEGACRIWWSAGLREPLEHTARKQA